jgi:hypothetical protein
VLCIDPGNVDANVTRLGPPKGERSGPKLDSPHIGETAAFRNDKIHALGVSHASFNSPRAGTRVGAKLARFLLRKDTSPMKDATPADDRRRRRSADPLVALHYQLSESRVRGALDAIVLADSSGVVVAGAGSWPMCEELAAFAPLLADGEWASMSDTVTNRVDTLRDKVTVRSMSVGGQDVLLCARHSKESATEGQQAIVAELDHASAGVSRILGLAA